MAKKIDPKSFIGKKIKVPGAHGGMETWTLVEYIDKPTKGMIRVSGKSFWMKRSKSGAVIGLDYVLEYFAEKL